MSSNNLEGRVAIVTGGGTGLGKGFAHTLAGAGAAVVVTGRRPGPIEEVAAEIAAAGGEALAVPCDQRSRDQVAAAVKATVDWKGKVDILVNNAGVYPPASFLDCDEQQWLDVIDTNVNGPFRFSQEAGRVMAAGGWGRIVNILSPSALLGFGFISAYGTSKGALASMTRAMAAELSGMGITVNSLVPGVTATETFVGFYTQVGVDILSNNLPIPRACSETDTAGALLLLASDAGAYITGTTLIVDGGMTSVFPMPT